MMKFRMFSFFLFLFPASIFHASITMYKRKNVRFSEENYNTVIDYQQIIPPEVVVSIAGHADFKSLVNWLCVAKKCSWTDAIFCCLYPHLKNMGRQHAEQDINAILFRIKKSPYERYCEILANMNTVLNKKEKYDYSVYDFYYKAILSKKLSEHYIPNIRGILYDKKTKKGNCYIRIKKKKTTSRKTFEGRLREKRVSITFTWNYSKNQCQLNKEIKYVSYKDGTAGGVVRFFGRQARLYE